MMTAKTMSDIAKIYKKVKFNKKFFGGVDEIDVWKKIEALHREYQSVFDVQEEVSRLRLEEKDEEIARLKARVKALETRLGVAHEE